jgi:putative phosphoribosyl transferase
MLGRHDAVEEVWVEVAEREVGGKLAVPQSPVGIVIFVNAARHGARDQTVAEALRARGLATFECDLFEDVDDRFDIEAAATRLLAVTDWIAEHSSVSHLPIGYLGAASGAAAALVAASRRPELIRAVVSRGGRADLAGAALPIVRAPTLLVAGGNDDHLIELDRNVVDQMTTCTQLAIIPGAGHAFDEPGALDEVIGLTSEWLLDHFAQEVPDMPRRPCRPFRDRRSAGERLAQVLQRFRGDDVIVCGLPRGGVVVADEIAKDLEAPLDVWLVRKLGMPIQPELGMGALAEGAALVLDPTNVTWSGTTPGELRSIVHATSDEIRRRAARYRSDAPPPDVDGKTVILVDDGIVTAGVVRAAIRGARKRGAARIVVAAPVIAAEAMTALQAEAFDVACLAMPRHLIAVGAWYQDFRKPPEQEVISLLEAARLRHSARIDIRVGA